MLKVWTSDNDSTILSVNANAIFLILEELIYSIFVSDFPLPYEQMSCYYNVSLLHKDLSLSLSLSLSADSIYGQIDPSAPEIRERAAVAPRVAADGCDDFASPVV